MTFLYFTISKGFKNFLYKFYQSNKKVLNLNFY